MGANGIPRFPRIMQLICVLIGEALVLAGFVFVPPAWREQTLIVPLGTWFIFAAVVVLLVPCALHRARLDKLRSLLMICHRCEKAIVTEGFALYEGEPLCESCAQAMEKLENRKLPRFAKGQSEHAQT